MIFAVVIVCLVISATFSGIEAGILSLNRVRLQHQVRLREKEAIKLNRLLSRPERVLTTVLFVTNFMNICAVALSTRELAHWLGPWGYAVALVVWLPLYLGIELLPKSIFRRFPYRALIAFSEVLRIADLILSPLLSIGSVIYNLFSARREQGRKQILVAREDLKFLTGESERLGHLSRLSKEMIHHVLDFRPVTARDIMSPLSAFPVIKGDAAVGELIEISRRTHLDRLPVAADSGEITGMVDVFEVMLDRKSDSSTVGAYARRIVTVAPEEPAYNVIRKLRAARASLAAVVDSRRHPLGIITSLQIMKRLVGAEGI